MERRLLLASLLLGVASSASAQPPFALVETDCVDEVEAALASRTSPIPEVEAAPAPRTSPIPEVEAALASPTSPTPQVEAAPSARMSLIPEGSSLANLREEPCLALLGAHDVPFTRLPSEEAPGVGIPIRLEGPLGGVRVASRGHSRLHEIMDCRLAVALLLWVPALRAAGVSGLLHYSTYRPGARVARTGRISGHASAMAIDVAVLVLEDGSELAVLDGWEARERGAAPCEGVRDESERSAGLRRLVCGIAGTFQIVLTPHYDAAHANHVHLELRPGVAWEYLR